MSLAPFVTTKQLEMLKGLAKYPDGFRGHMDQRIAAGLIKSGLITGTNPVGDGRPLYRLTVKGYAVLMDAAQATEESL